MQASTAGGIPGFKEGPNPGRTIGGGVSKPLDKRFPYMPGIDAMRALAVLGLNEVAVRTVSEIAETIVDGIVTTLDRAA